MENKAISVFTYLDFESSMSLDVIRVLQNNNIFYCRLFRAYSLIGIIKCYLFSQALDLQIELFAHFC